MAALYLANQLRRYGAQPILARDRTHQTFDLERIQGSAIREPKERNQLPLNLSLKCLRWT